MYLDILILMWQILTLQLNLDDMYVVFTRKCKDLITDVCVCMQLLENEVVAEI